MWASRLATQSLCPESDGAVTDDLPMDARGWHRRRRRPAAIIVGGELKLLRCALLLQLLAWLCDLGGGPSLP